MVSLKHWSLTLTLTNSDITSFSERSESERCLGTDKTDTDFTEKTLNWRWERSIMRADLNVHEQSYFRWALQITVHHIVLRKWKSPWIKRTPLSEYIGMWLETDHILNFKMKCSPIFIRHQQITAWIYRQELTGWFAASKLCWDFVLSCLVLLMLPFEMQSTSHLTVFNSDNSFREWLRDFLRTDRCSMINERAQRGHCKRFVCHLP